MNRKIIKAGILLATLVLPVFVFLFLRFFSQNHFALPRFIPEIDSLSGKVKMAEKIEPIKGTKIIDTVYHTLPSFSLLDENGSVFSNKIIENNITIASFIFTRCGVICPKTVKQLNRVQEHFENTEIVKIISYTVDPKYDTPEVLKKYANENEAINNKWFFVTGDKKDIYQLALKGYFVPLSDASEYNKAIKNPDEAFIHTEKLILVDKEGIIRGYYDGTNSKEVDRLVLETKILLDIYKKQDEAK